MKRWIGFFLFCVCRLFASSLAVAENDPNALVEGVSVITGDYYQQEEDLVVQGVCPIVFKRTYMSDKGKGIWNLFPYHRAMVGHRFRTIVLTLPSGAEVLYDVDYDRKKRRDVVKLDPSVVEMVNTANGSLSSRSNLKNQRIYLAEDKKTFTVFASDGTKRVYHRSKDQGFICWCKRELFGEDTFSDVKRGMYIYYLIKEELPNGHRILYNWPRPSDRDKVFEIRSTDASEKITYAWAKIHPHLGEDGGCSGNYGIETSDGRHLEYRFFSYRGEYQLKEIESDEAPLQTLHYLTHDKNKVLNAITFPHHRSIHLSYYTDKDKPDYLCVRQLLSPAPHVQPKEGYPHFTRKGKLNPLYVDPPPTQEVTHTFFYDFTERKTTVLDAYGVPTDYRWDENKHLTEIRRFKQDRSLHSYVRFVWGKQGTRESGDLLAKVLYDERDRPFQAVRYFYDDYGNVKEEVLFGQLTGESKPFTVDAEGLPLAAKEEGYSKRSCYAHHGRVVKEKEEDNGYRVKRHHLNGSILITEECHYDKGIPKKRVTYGYNARNIQTERKEEDVTRGTFLLTKTHLRSEHEKRYAEMPDVIEEYCGDAKGQRLLRKTKLHYGSGGRVEGREVFDAEGKLAYSLSYRYHRGCLVEETNALGQRAIYGYDELNNRIYEKGFGKAAEIHVGYDLLNRIEWVKEQAGSLERVHQEFYNTLHHKIEEIDEFGHKTLYRYDCFGNILEIWHPTGGVDRFTYDAAGSITSCQDAEGYTTSMTNNLYGKPVVVLHPDGGREEFIYYKDGLLACHVDPLGLRTSYQYDAFGRVTSKDEAGRVERYEYNAYSLIKKTSPEGRTIIYEYDAANRKVAEKMEGEEPLFYEYDSLGRLHKERKGDLVKVYIRDLLDRVIEERKETLSGGVLEKVRYRYDAMGNKDQILRDVEGKEAIERFDYDALGRLVKSIDPLGHETTYSYFPKEKKKVKVDPLGQQTIEIDNALHKPVFIEKKSPSGAVLTQEYNTYDRKGNKIFQEIAFARERRKTSWRYGPRDHLLEVKEAVGTDKERSTRYGYSLRGELVEVVKPSGLTLYHRYDIHGNLEQERSSDGSISYTYHYDLDGLLLRADDEVKGMTIERTYDMRGRLVKESLPRNRQLTFSYDRMGRRRELKIPNGSFVTYDYEVHRLKSVKRYTSQGQHLYTHRYLTYDLGGRLLEEETPVGKVVRSYDLMGRPTLIASPHFKEEIKAFDAVSNPLQIVRQGREFNFRYDDLYQLVSEEGYSYAYDELYNRKGKNGVDWEIDPLNQVSFLSYDADGNPLAFEGKSLSYDALDRLIEVRDGKKVVRYGYDALHRRLAKWVFNLGGELNDEVYYLYDGEDEIGSVDARGRLKEFRVLGIEGKGELGSAVAIEIEGEVKIPTHDLRGNVAALYGNMDTEYYTYTAFGESDDVSKNPWRFSSKRVDPETGFTFFGRRYYLPKLGRFLTQDPLGFDAGPNVYAFVFNAPLTHVDCRGLFAEAPPLCLSNPFQPYPAYGFSGGLGDWQQGGLNFSSMPGSGLGSSWSMPPYSTPLVTQTCPFTPSSTRALRPLATDYSSGYYTVGSVTVPGADFLYINGMNTTLEEAKQSAQHLMNHTGVDYRITGIYSHTRGIAKDVAGCAGYALGLTQYDEAQLLIDYVKKFHIRNLFDESRKICLIYHSRGSLIVDRAMKELGKLEKARLFCIGLAPAKPIVDEHLADSVNYASRYDPIPLLRFGGYIITLGLHKGLVEDIRAQKELIRLKPAEGTPLFDHSVMSPTFQEVVGDNVNDYFRLIGVK